MRFDLKAFWLASTILAGAASLAGVTAGPAAAADLAYKAPPAAEVWNPWLVRVRALGIVTRDSGRIYEVSGSDLETSDTVVPELDISYFFTPNWAVEVIAGTTQHTIHVSAPPALDGLKVGSAWLLPPIVSLQYHFTNFGAFKPYVGVGANYTFFFSQEAGNEYVGGVAVVRSKLHNAAGAALQVGFDWFVDRHWGFNIDVKKLFLKTDWDGVLSNGAQLAADVDLDPWLISAGVTYKF
jgi:outer membrane protein